MSDPAGERVGRSRASIRSRVVSRSLGRGLQQLRGQSSLHEGLTHDELAARVQRMRPGLEALAARAPVLPDTRIEKVLDAPVPGEWVRPSMTGANAIPVVLHLHGGAFVLCSPVTHRGITRALARVSRGVAWVPQYRLAPDDPYPAALDDAVTTYRWLLDEVGVPSDQIAVTGDSAGGGLALSLLLRAREEGLPMPACYVGLSPWTDLTGGSPSIAANNGRDAVFGTIPISLASRLGELYAKDTEDPLVSPVFADLTGLPPMLVHVGTDELIRDDGLRLVARAREQGVDASVGQFLGMWHVFQAFPVPEARRSFREIGGFIRRHTGPGH